MNKSILLVFFFSVFFVLSFTSAGVFLNDEWMTAASLRQLEQGHQIKYNEGSYGYFANGTPGNYMEKRNNTLMYTVALPMASLPVMEIFNLFGDHFRMAIVIFWILSGFISLKLLQEIFVMEWRKMLPGYIAVGLLSIANLVLYTDYPWYGIFIPRETAAIVMTNTLLFGGFMVGAYLLTTRIWQEWKWRLLGTISVMCCSSLMFWTGTLKDHMLVATLVIFITYFIITYIETKETKHMIMASIFIGLLAWTRAEVAVGIAILSLILILYYGGLKNTVVSALVTGISSLPFLINNYIVSGSIFITPFMVSNEKYTFQYTVVDAWQRLGTVNMVSSVFYTIVRPVSGAVPLMTVIPLFILLVIVLPYILIKRRISLTKIDIALIATSVGSLAYHIYNGNIILQQYDTGIFPDLRYLTPAYAGLTLLSLSILSRSITIDVKDTIRKIPIFAMLLLVISTAIIVVLPNALGQQSGFNTLISLVTLATFAITLVLLIIGKREGRNYNGTILALLIVIPLIWVIITSFLYNTLKVSGYSQLLPISEYLYNMIF